jgi:hypothetical protein
MSAEVAAYVKISYKMLWIEPMVRRVAAGGGAGYGAYARNGRRAGIFLFRAAGSARRKPFTHYIGLSYYTLW